MEITRINDGPYSRELVAEIERSAHDFLRDAMINASRNPYDFTSTGDIVTLRFDRGDYSKEGVTLPFQTNATLVYNATDYYNEPKWNSLKNLFVGKLKSVHPQRLDEFLELLNRSSIFDITRYAHRRHTQDYDFNTREGPRLFRNDKTKFKYISTREDIDCLRRDFIDVSAEFTIDPTSDVRIEERELKDGRKIFTAALSTRMSRGLSGVPRITYLTEQKIKAEEK